jgi:hypothetical protein
MLYRRVTLSRPRGDEGYSFLRLGGGAQALTYSTFAECYGLPSK